MKRRLHVVVSAGPTREYLDDVRFLSNPSSGRMGFAVAEAARAAGHRVTLVTGPVHLDPPPGIRTIRITSALEMRRAVLAAFRTADALVMTAAVSDYRPAQRKKGKWKKGAQRISLPLVRNPDILAEATATKGRRICVGFAVEVRGALAAARGKLRRKNLDALCLCSPAAFEVGAAHYRILHPAGAVEDLPRCGKPALARRIVALIERATGPR